MLIPSNQELAQVQNAVRDVYAYAARRWNAGATESQLESELQTRGLDEQSAVMIMDDLLTVRNASLASKGRKNMVRGGLWFGGGLLVTFLTYSAAVSSGGGIYIVTWGAILFGAVQFLEGIAQFLRSRDVALDHDAVEAAADTRYIVVANGPQRGRWLSAAAQLAPPVVH